MKFCGIMDMKCEEWNENLKEYHPRKQVEKVSHWANLKHINLISSIKHWSRRGFFWIFREKAQAVLTVEAALIVPVFILALCTVMGILDCYRIQSTVKTSIHQSAMELGMYAYVNSQDDKKIAMLNSAICVAYAQKKLPKFEENVSVSMISSHYKNNTITLIAIIKYRFPIQLFPVPPLKLVNVSEVYGWVGESNSEKDEEASVAYKMVYVTNHESVYHTSANCSHLNLKIYEAKKENIYREYEPCQKCCRGQEVDRQSSVYYTKTGDCYHVQKNCSSLKRIVRMVEASKVNELSLCKRCKKRGNL